MKSKTLLITQTGLMLALLIALQWLTRPFGQLVTGSFVNAVLACSVLIGGIWSGLFIALLSPVFAWLLGIAAQVVTVPAIMAGNAALVVVLYLLATVPLPFVWNKILSILAASVAKFLLLYFIVVKIICGIASAPLLNGGLLKEPMLDALPATFAWPQLFTALIGCTAASLIVPVIRKATKK